MSRKTTIYIVSIVVLLGLNLLLFFNESNKGNSFDDQLFSVADTTAIKSVSILKEAGEILLEREGSGWRLNNKYRADVNFQQVLSTILSRVRVQREVGKLEGDGTIKVEMEGESLVVDFKVGSLGTKTFFIKDGVGYQVEVPGYRENVGNIFELTEDQWRSRLVFNGSWRTIQSLELTGQDHSLDIRFNDKFFSVAGVDRIDSTAVINYLNQFQFLQANEMISSGKFPELDSLKNTSPLATLAIDDIASSGTIRFEIYPSLYGHSYHLVTKNGEDMMVFSLDRIRELLKSASDFQLK